MQDKQDRFVRILGKSRAEKLQSLWDNTYPEGCGLTFKPKEEVFIRKAKEEGFTSRELKLFFKL
jgi:hypothetical protein